MGDNGPQEAAREEPVKSRLRIAREKAGLSIKQAAGKLDWPIWMIENYETGYSVPSSGCLRWLADTYGVSVAWLRADPARKGNSPDEVL